MLRQTLLLAVKVPLRRKAFAGAEETEGDIQIRFRDGLVVAVEEDEE